MFDAFKKSSFVPKTSLQTLSSVSFQIIIQGQRVFLKVLNDFGLPLSEIDPSLLQGREQQIVKKIISIKKQDAFTVAWEKNDNETIDALLEDEMRISLTDHPQLLEYLKQCNHIYDQKDQQVTFSQEMEHVFIAITAQDTASETLRANLRLSRNQPVTAILAENYVLSDTTIYEILPLGYSYASLQDSFFRFPYSFLAKYISIIISHFDNVEIMYQEYQIVQAEKLVAQPVLLIDEIGEDNMLHIRLSFRAGGMDPDFFATYEINKAALIHDGEKNITIHALDRSTVAFVYDEFVHMLEKYQKELKKKNTYAIDIYGFTLHEDLATLIMEKELGTILTRYHVMGAKNLKKYKIHAPVPKLHLSLSEGINFLEGDASLQIGEQTFGLFDALQLYQKHSYIPLNNGDKAILNQDYLKKLSRIFQKKKDGKVLVSFFDLPLIDQMLDEATQKGFGKTRAFFEGLNTIKENPLPKKKLGLTLRDYQTYGVQWLRYLYDNSLSGCLADDMGLGKTIQAITLLSHIYPKNKQTSLIVVPKSLLFNWKREIEKINPQLSTYIYYNDQRDIKEIKKHHLVITTYHTLRSDIEKFTSISFDTVILDESGNIKNPDSQISKSVCLLKASHRFALSGTPVENNLGELFALFRFLEPAMFRSQSDFLTQYLYPIQKENDEEALEELRKKLYPFILRRTKKQVLPDLPDKVEQVVLVELSSEYLALYESRRRYYHDLIQNQVKQNGLQKSQFFIFQALSELRQMVSCPEEKTDGLVVSPKREILKERLAEALANNHKVLIFTQFLNAIETIADDVESLGVEYVTLSGATTNREKIVDQFENDPGCRVFIATLKTGGFGLNLTSADTVFIYDPWWNHAAENQAIDRAHRMGQKNTVFAYKLIAKGTIEEKMLQLQEKKAKLFSQLLPTDTSVIKSLSEEDIAFMLE